MDGALNIRGITYLGSVVVFPPYWNFWLRTWLRTIRYQYFAWWKLHNRGSE